MSYDSPLVSVLIPAYNCSKFINEAVKSVLEQSYNNIEILICDDCSLDNTYDIITELANNNSNIKVLNNNVNLGYLNTFNKLLFESNGDYISFLDADDYLHRDKIRLQLERFEKNSKLGLCGCNFISISKNGAIIRKSDYPLSDEQIREQMKFNFCFCGSSVMIKKEVRDKIGGYRPFFKDCVGEDVDWIHRIMEQYSVQNIKIPGYYYRFHVNSLTRKVYFSIKQRHIFDIIYYLKEQRNKSGNDFVFLNNHVEYNNLIQELSLPYKLDKTLLYRKVVIEYSINKDRINAIMYMKRLLKISTFSISVLRVLFLMIILLYVNENILIWLKRVTGISHLSSRL